MALCRTVGRSIRSISRLSSARVLAPTGRISSEREISFSPVTPLRLPRATRKRQRVAIMASDGSEIAEHFISLTEQEQRIFHLLRDVLSARHLPTVVRVAGGWVRDKILGRENHDIDIALDDSTGESFATVVNDYLASSGMETHSVNVIQANPEQSKHLETATVNVLGAQIDFVNLRAEEYAADSRIPTVRFGSAKEDAMRRDFTINALFYNVNDDTIEDLTGFGFSDLQSGVVRTPLAPITTLLDDPLRVLRAIRFSSRFGFSLAEDLQEALALEEVHAALATKVSRERCGAELDSMLAGARPVSSLRVLHAVRVFPVVFSVPRLASFSEAEAAAVAFRKRKGGGTRKGAASSASPEEEAALALADWLTEAADWRESLSEAASEGVEQSMRVVNAVDTALGRRLADDSTDASASAEATADATEPRAVRVRRGDALQEADKLRAASIVEVSRDDTQAQCLPDLAGRSTWLDAQQRRTVLLAAALWNVRDAWALGCEGKERGKSVSAASWMIKASLKRRTKDAEDVDTLHRVVPMMLLAFQQGVKAGVFSPAAGAVFIRACHSSAPWNVSQEGPLASRRAYPPKGFPQEAVLDGAVGAFDAACGAAGVTDPLEQARLAVGLAVRDAAALLPEALVLTAATVLACCSEPTAVVFGAVEELERFIVDSGLEGCAEWRAPVDGKGLRTLGVTAGPAMKPLLDAQVFLRMARPTVTDEQCIDTVKEWIASSSAPSPAS
jgi:tRNA nucleotidyltransferase/poly(A) polymerase